jgi:DNA-binding NarL/FixJ family response regulator
MARWTNAEAHFVDAVAMNERIGGLAPLAHAMHDFAAMLLARDNPGDRERAHGLLCQARDSATALGLVAVRRKVEARLKGLAVPVASVPDDLTARELEVLRLLAIGRGNADIAMVLSISLNTVATHVRNIFAKTGCANRTEAAAYAMRHGLHAAG